MSRTARRRDAGRVPSRAPAARARTITWCFSLSTGAIVTYNDARRFGFMDLVPRARARDLPPVRRAWASSRSATSCRARPSPACSRGKRTPLKAALLDQRLIAGLGNIYVCEALFRARLSPAAPGRLPRDRSGRADRQSAGSSPRSSATCSTKPSRPAARPCATTPRRTGRSAISSTASGSTTGRATLHHAGLHRHVVAHGAIRPLHLLLPGLPGSLTGGQGNPLAGETLLPGRPASPTGDATISGGDPNGFIRQHPGRTARPGRPHHASTGRRRSMR